MESSLITLQDAKYCLSSFDFSKRDCSLQGSENTVLYGDLHLGSGKTRISNSTLQCSLVCAQEGGSLILDNCLLEGNSLLFQDVNLKLDSCIVNLTSDEDYFSALELLNSKARIKNTSFVCHFAASSATLFKFISSQAQLQGVKTVLGFSDPVPFILYADAIASHVRIQDSSLYSSEPFSCSLYKGIRSQFHLINFNVQSGSHVEMTGSDIKEGDTKFSNVYFGKEEVFFVDDNAEYVEGNYQDYFNKFSHSLPSGKNKLILDTRSAPVIIDLPEDREEIFVENPYSGLVLLRDNKRGREIKTRKEKLTMKCLNGKWKRVK
ncbi:Hypothetical protein BRZCDTV_316 [Brazilian cedratvirus IHUMI]|uniref:Uncharacterized protein n=1 Tax=Brazilian cedratvirus IHUMI TaxID=2126980 RepID=A0A2R8FEJ1_9VIRU|nr:Hypothetical protein BRZCDTV_316 [Brazilian cedratvirus IHUMI]